MFLGTPAGSRSPKTPPTLTHSAPGLTDPPVIPLSWLATSPGVMTINTRVHSTVLLSPPETRKSAQHVASLTVEEEQRFTVSDIIF